MATTRESGATAARSAAAHAKLALLEEFQRCVDAASAAQLGEYIATFRKHKVRFSFNTDGPEMLRTTLRDELKLALARGWVSKEELAQCGGWARDASFLSRSDA